MGVSEAAARPLAIEVVGGDEVLAVRVRAALARERMRADVRRPVARDERTVAVTAPPDVVVLAVPPDRPAAPAVRALRRRLPDTRIVLTLAPGACRSGARSAIDAVADGVVADADLDVALGPIVRCARAGYVATPAAAREPEPPPLTFSRRERQIVRLVVLGLTNEEIAQRLFVAKSTVAGHLTAIFRRLGVRSRRELVARVLSGEDTLRRAVLAVAVPGDDRPAPGVAA
jgi:two-component system, NarL family, response regulator LiaR